MFSVTDGSVTASEITALETMAATLVTPLVGLAGNFSLCIPPNTTDPVEEITDYAGRPTPSVIRSRRIRQFLVG
jgi:hypothetical protein